MQSWKRTIPILLLGSTLLLFLGCGSMPAGVDPANMWKVILPEPDPLVLTGEDKAAILKFSGEHPDTFKKIKNQSDAYRKIIVEYNKRARKQNEEGLKALGLNKEKVREIYPNSG